MWCMENHLSPTGHKLLNSGLMTGSKGVSGRMENTMTCQGKTIALACLLLWSAASANAAQEHVKAMTSVNLRKCPDLAVSACSTVRTLEPQTEMEIIGRHLDWFQVRVLPAGEEGWVHSKYVTAPFGGTGETARRKRTHDWTYTLLIAFAVLGAVYYFVALAKTNGGAQHPLFKRLLLDPRIAISWVFFCEGALLGVLFLTSSLNSNQADLSLKDYAVTAVFFGYAAWSLYWGTPACWQAWRKCVVWFVSFSLIGLFGLLISIVPALWLAGMYSFWGGGLLHFGRRWIAG